MVEESIMANSRKVRMVGLAANQMFAAKQQGKIVEILKILLANEFILCAKLRDYHCISTNAHFYSLHAICESQADNIAALAHAIDERIRQYELCKSRLMDESIWKADLIGKASIRSM
jgi:DNA-binding ferritin-like protein